MRAEWKEGMERGHGMGELRSMISKETGKNGNLFPICAAGIKMQSHRRLTFLRSNPQRNAGGGVAAAVARPPFLSAIPRFPRATVPSYLSTYSYLSVPIAAAAILPGNALALGISCQSVAPAEGGEEKFSCAFLSRMLARGIDPSPSGKGVGRFGGHRRSRELPMQRALLSRNKFRLTAPTPALSRSLPAAP